MESPTKRDISELLSGQIKMTVPKYQRDFDWKGDQQVKDLFADIFDCIESSNNNDLFLGTMIFDISKRKTKEEIEIIDGQQRITTILIILIACREYAKKVLKDNGLASSIQYKISKVNAINESEGVKLESSHTIRKVFENMCDPKWDGEFLAQIFIGKKRHSVRLQNRRLKPIYEYVYSEVERYCTTKRKYAVDKFKKFLTQLYHKTYVIEINITEKEEAFEIFERTNARGKGLEIADLLKNFLFSKNKNIDIEIEEYWGEITDCAGSSMQRMLKYFWVSRKGYISNRELYRHIRLYANEIGINKFVEELREFSIFYSNFMSSERGLFKDWLLKQNFVKRDMILNEAQRSISALKFFGMTQTVPLVFSAFRSYSKSKTPDPKKFLTFLRLIESHHFVNNNICNRIGNDIEKTYANFSEEFYNNGKFNSLISEFESDLKDKLAKEAEFIGNFSTLSYNDISSKSSIRYIFDQIANCKIKDGARFDLIDYYSLNNQVRESNDIEHLYSQSKADEIDNDSALHEMGNLLVIPQQINGILQDKDFATKINIFLHPEKYDNNIKNIPGYVREFAKEYKNKKKWTIDDIKKRTIALAKKSYQIATEGYKYK